MHWKNSSTSQETNSIAVTPKYLQKLIRKFSGCHNLWATWKKDVLFFKLLENNIVEILKCLI